MVTATDVEELLVHSSNLAGSRISTKVDVENKEEIEKRNCDAIIKMFGNHNMTKDFEISYTDPRSGKLLVRIEGGHVMLVELKQLLGSDGKTFEEQVKQNQFLLR